MTGRINIDELAFRFAFVQQCLHYIGVDMNKDSDFKNYIDQWLDLRRPDENDEKWAWCSAFLIGIFNELGYDIAADLSARSWLQIGDKVACPEVGDIVVFWRESPKSWKGHVGVYLGRRGRFLVVLGGNQSGKVSVQLFSNTMLLGFRSMMKFLVPFSVCVDLSELYRKIK